jgi:hypothetical protein
MKKSMFLCLLLTSFVLLLARPAFQFNLGIDTSGEFHYSTDNELSFTSTSVLPGCSPSVEILYHASKRTFLGYGVEYQIPREFRDFASGDVTFGFVPIYATAKIAPVIGNKVRAEIIANLGGDYLTGNREFRQNKKIFGGPYFAIGLGMNAVSGFTASVLFQQCAGQIRYPIRKSAVVKYRYDTVLFNLGYRI